MFERSIRDAEIIERWGIVRSHRRGSMGAHAHRVAVYADQIAEAISWQGDRGALLRYALWHDMPELVTGDIPGPVKRKLIDPVALRRFEMEVMNKLFPSLAWICPSDEVAAIVKVADCVDELLWIAVEQRMGNDLLATVAADSMERFKTKVKKLPCSIVVRQIVINQVTKSLLTHRVDDPQSVTDHAVRGEADG